MTETAKKPAIRFDGFTEAWEQRKLSEYLEVSSEKNTEDTFTKQDVLSVSGDYGIVNQIEFQGRSFAGASVSNYGVVRTGDVVYTKSPLNLNPYGIIKTNKGKPGIVSTLYAVYHPRETVVPDFVQVYFEQHARMNNYMHPLVNKGAKNDMKVSSENALKGDVIFPDITEQRQNVALFAKLDNLITLHQQKYDKLLTFKKSMLEKLFPKDGAKVPEVRFAGFDGEWERRKLRDLYEPVTQKNDLTYGINDNITVASMQYKTDIKVTDVDYLRTYNVFLLGDIAFEGHQSKEFRYGRFVENDIGNGIVSHIFTVFRPKCEYDLSYWKYAINNEKLMRPILSCCTKASTMMNDLVAKDFLDSCIRVPTIDEQRKIGAFLKSLDELVSLYGAELEKLKNIKSALLEKMFV